MLVSTIQRQDLRSKIVPDVVEIEMLLILNISLVFRVWEPLEIPLEGKIVAIDTVSQSIL